MVAAICISPLLKSSRRVATAAEWAQTCIEEPQEDHGRLTLDNRYGVGINYGIIKMAYEFTVLFSRPTGKRGLGNPLLWAYQAMDLETLRHIGLQQVFSIIDLQT
jgi:hypothetical protein